MDVCFGECWGSPIRKMLSSSCAALNKVCRLRLHALRQEKRVSITAAERCRQPTRIGPIVRLRDWERNVKFVKIAGMRSRRSGGRIRGKLFSGLRSCIRPIIKIVPRIRWTLVSSIKSCIHPPWWRLPTRGRKHPSAEKKDWQTSGAFKAPTMPLGTGKVDI